MSPFFLTSQKDLSPSQDQIVPCCQLSLGLLYRQGTSFKDASAPSLRYNIRAPLGQTSIKSSPRVGVALDGVLYLEHELTAHFFNFR